MSKEFSAAIGSVNKIDLRPIDEKDLPLLKEWLYLPHVAKWYHDPLDWINEVENRHGEFAFLHHFIVEINGNPVGFCQYYAYERSGEDWHGDTETQGTYSIDYMIGDTQYIGKGFGKAIVHKLIEKIAKEYGVKRIIVQPDPENAASFNTLLSCGFVFDEKNEIYIKNL